MQLSFFLSLVAKIQLNQWNKWLVTYSHSSCCNRDTCTCTHTYGTVATNLGERVSELKNKNDKH